MKNDYKVIGDEVIIYINNGPDILETKISRKSFGKANTFPNTWYAQYSQGLDSFYVHGHLYNVDGKKQITVLLHRWITDAPKDKVVDHINHDTLDNRLSNLRICTHAENLQNRKSANSMSRSGIRGVGFHKKTGKWRARVTLNGEQMHLGVFETKEEAEEVVIKARKELLKFTKN